MSKDRVVTRKTVASLIVVVVILSAALVSALVVFYSTYSDNNTLIAHLTGIVNLQNQEIVVSESAASQQAGELSAVIHRAYAYSGYLTVSVNSNTSNAYILLQYWLNGQLYSYNQTVGTSGQAFFAIPKTDSATVYAGSSDSSETAIETITVTYYY
jgi:hypothetical protein